MLGELQVRTEPVAESNLWVDWDLDLENVTPDTDGACFGLCATNYTYKFMAMKSVPGTDNFVVA